MAEWGIFGGAGFIGQHLAYSILQSNPRDGVTLLDIQSPKTLAWKAPLGSFQNEGRLAVIETDVRDFPQLQKNSKKFDVVVNLAAIHREPGHKSHEYFDTNVAGAQNVCQLAESINCKEIIFTSSIAVYGIHNRSVDENSAINARTPYGQSKLQAEMIHRRWVEKSHGRLTIIRPGVVFGHGENGNVTRLVRESLRFQRRFQIRPDQPKAGIYIEELLAIIHWLRKRPWHPGQCRLLNAVSNESLTFNTYGICLQQLVGFKKRPIVVSESLINFVTSISKPLGVLLQTDSRFHPERLAKIIRANDVRASVLSAEKYPYAWPLDRALQDWLSKGL